MSESLENSEASEPKKPSSSPGMMIWLLPLGVFLALVVLLWSGLGGNPQEVPSALVGKSVPQFELPSLHDPELKHVTEDFSGQAYLINVWGTWCPTCRIEHPDLLAIAEAGVPILGLNYKDERNAAKGYLEQFGNPFRWSVFDELGALGFDLGVTGAPETFLVDSQGVIRYRHVGVLTLAQWNQVLFPLYEEAGGVLEPDAQPMAP